MRGPGTKILAWGMASAYAALIFYLSSLAHPFPPIEPYLKYHVDKIIHVIEYGLFGILLVRAFWLSLSSPSVGFLFAAAWLVGTLYGFSDEWHQRYVPGRQPTAADAAVDSIGVAIGTLLWMKKNKGMLLCPK